MPKSSKPAKRRRSIVPAWVPFVAAVSLSSMLVLTINFRAFTALDREAVNNQELNTKILQAMHENIELQEEIHYLKNDAKTIEREARKFGLEPVKEKVSEPTK
jgi:cell division protein FtsB